MNAEKRHRHSHGRNAPSIGLRKNHTSIAVRSVSRMNAAHKKTPEPKAPGSDERIELSTGKMDVIRYAIKINNLGSNWARLMT
jgi:hypothetical protein